MPIHSIQDSYRIKIIKYYLISTLLRFKQAEIGLRIYHHVTLEYYGKQPLLKTVADKKIVKFVLLLSLLFNVLT